MAIKHRYSVLKNAMVRRGLNIVLRYVATRTDVVLEDVLSNCPNLHIINDEPALAGGWFRLIELIKKS